MKEFFGAVLFGLAFLSGMLTLFVLVTIPQHWALDRATGGNHWKWQVFLWRHRWRVLLFSGVTILLFVFLHSNFGPLI